MWHCPRQPLTRPTDRRPRGEDRDQNRERPGAVPGRRPATFRNSRDTAVEGDIATQTEQALRNLGAILEAAGSSLDNLVKTSVFLQDLGDFAAMNEVYARHVGDRPPARSTFEVAKLPSGALVEIEAVAHL